MAGEQIKMSQGYDVLQPRSGEAYPIPCDEWDLLRNRLETASEAPLGFHTSGSILLGAAVTTAISILVGAIPSTDSALTAAWAVVIASALCGGLCLYFAWRERQQRKGQVSDVVAQMGLIERRYARLPENPTATLEPAGIQITRARYGARQRENDVAAILRQALRPDGLRLKVENDTLGGDPCKGTAKKLVVEYVHNGTTGHKIVDEHDWLQIP